MRLTQAWGRALPGRPGPVRLAIGVALAGLAWMAHALGVFEPLDRKLLDFYLVARGEREPLAPIVIVAIDYESLQRAGHRWPWPRSLHARLLRKLGAAEASVVALDVLFLETDPPQDRELARAAEDLGNVIWASAFGRADEHQRFRLLQHRPPAQGLQVASSAFGYVDLPFDPDGYIRRVSPIRHFGPIIHKSFAAVIAERYRREPLLHLSAAGTRWPGPSGAPVPAQRDGSLLINFAGPPGTFPTVPYIWVLEGRVPPETFKGKIVLVGATGDDTDRFFTPFYSRWLPETSRPMAGVEIHANIVDMILGGRFLARAGWAWHLLLFLAIGLAASLFVNRGRAWLTVGALAAAVGACLALGYLVLVSLDLWLAVAGPALCAWLPWGALLFHGLIVERKEKEFVRSTLERYVSPAVVQEVMSRRIDLALGGKRQTITVLFSDIRGFTDLAERIPPEALVQILNQHFTAAGDIILRHGGTLDKFIGDAVMAFWGAPVPREDHALLAVRTALEMQAAVRGLDAQFRERLGERLRVGIGINTGDAVVGHIGTPRRLGYTAIGDPVNLAARVEAMTREEQAEILITQFTYELVKFSVDAEPLGVVPVRGRKDPVAIYRVRGLKEIRRPGSVPGTSR
jgi:adenylate cyclase